MYQYQYLSSISPSTSFPQVHLFLLNEGLIHEELDKTDEADERVRRLDRLLMECKDAIQLVRDDLKTDAVRRLGGTGNWFY